MCRAGHFDDALSALERFNILCSSSDSDSRQGIIPPRSTRTVERLRHQLADKQFKLGNIEEMEKVLTHLPSAADRITFLKKRGCIVEAARALEKEGRRDEAVRLLRDTGRFQEAVTFSSDPQFAADCLISQARTTEISEDIPRILKSALVKYQHCNDINGQAEALLMLGKQLREVQNIQEAGKLFDKCENYSGEVESLSELLKATANSPPARFRQWIAVRALERLLSLVTLLYKPASQLSNAEHNEIEKCEKHFGLFRTGVAHKKVYFCHHGARFSKIDPEFDQHNASETEIAINTADAHQKIGCFLINLSASLIPMIREMLEKSFLRNSVCRRVTDGTVCDNSGCEYQHEDSEGLFHNRFHALFNYVYLESVVEQGILELVENNGRKDVSPLRDKNFKEFQSCQRFYNFLFPSSGCRRHHITLSHVRSIWMTKAVNRRISQFAYFLWKGTPEEERRLNTDNFLRVSSSLQLIGYASNMVTWIWEEEENFNRKAETAKLTNEQLVKNGMVPLSCEDGSACYESYLQWWEYGKKKLYVDGDVENAAHFIVRRFLTFTAKRRGMIYPSIANTVMILEHQMTACLALYTRLCSEHRYPICLPGSYLTTVRFWDNFRPGVEKYFRPSVEKNFRPGVEKRTFTLYQAVEYNASQETSKLRLFKAVGSVLNYMVRLTCGEVASSFDVVGDALAMRNTPVEEAERSLVLFLTMLCNCGKGISTSGESVLIRKMLKLSPNLHLPSNMKKALEGIQEAKGPSDIVAVLKKFLESRGEELYDLRWQNSRLWYDGPSRPSAYLHKFHSDISTIREELKQDKQQLKVEEPQGSEAPGLYDTGLERADPDATAENMEVMYTDEELKKKQEARLEVITQRLHRRKRIAKKICLYAKALKLKMLSRSRSTEEQTKALKDGSYEHFSRFKADSTACGICGTNFTASAEENFLISHEGNEGKALYYLRVWF